MMIAGTGGKIVVKGRRIAIPDVGPNPGSTPISVPTKQPMKLNNTFSGVKAVAKPCNNNE